MNHRPWLYLIVLFSIALLLISAAFLARTFLPAALLSIFLAYILFPLHRYLSGLIGERHISALICTAILLLVTLSILGVAVQSLMQLSNLGQPQNVQLLASELSDRIFNLTLDRLPAQATEFFNATAKPADQHLSILPGFIKLYIEQQIASLLSMPLTQIISQMESSALRLIADLPGFLAYALLVLIFTYYFLSDGSKALKQLAEVMPESKLALQYLEELDAVYIDLFRGRLFIYLFIGIIGAVGFYYMGVPLAPLWGVVLAISALLPVIGPGFVSLALALYLLQQGDMDGFYVLAFAMVFLLFVPYALVRPQVAAGATPVHPLLAFTAFVAPIMVVGISGVILGPLVFGALYAIYKTLRSYRDLKPGAPEQLKET
jgi:predicted PurR-regulated permease PerM